MLATIHPTVSWFRWLVAALSRWRTGFNRKAVHVGFVVGKVARGTGFFFYVLWLPLSGSFNHCPSCMFHSSITDATRQYCNL